MNKLRLLFSQHNLVFSTVLYWQRSRIQTVSRARHPSDKPRYDGFVFRAHRAADRQKFVWASTARYGLVHNRLYAQRLVLGACRAAKRK